MPSQNGFMISTSKNKKSLTSMFMVNYQQHRLLKFKATVL